MNANPPLFPLGSQDLLLSCLFVPLLPTLYTLIRRSNILEEAYAFLMSSYPLGVTVPFQISQLVCCTLQRKYYLCFFFFWELHGLSPNFHIHLSVGDLYFPGSVHIFGCSKIDRPIQEIYKSLTDTVYECRKW
jgi:hypothetical protein